MNDLRTSAGKKVEVIDWEELRKDLLYACSDNPWVCGYVKSIDVMFNQIGSMGYGGVHIGIVNLVSALVTLSKKYETVLLAKVAREPLSIVVTCCPRCGYPGAEAHVEKTSDS
jgi:hypothetical protein